jgi:hypothetical protein
VGQTADGTVLLVTAEGPAQGSRGLTVAEQAELMADLGADVAIAMDGGGSAQLALGRELAIPWSPPRTIASALVLRYAGVRLGALPPRLSPNGDRVRERTRAVVRVTAAGETRVTVAGRGGRPTRRLFEGRLDPGAHPVVVDPRALGLADGAYVLVSRFRTDDGGAESSHRRSFVVDRTLSHLRLRAILRRVAVPGPRPRGGRRLRRPAVQARFRLLRPARVTVRVRDDDLQTLRTLVRDRLLGRGRHLVVWDRRVGDDVVSGAVGVSVEARNRLGTSGLVGRLTLRPPPGGRGRPQGP